MKDIELYGLLKAAGVAPNVAWTMTRDIRDRWHPIAAVAAAKLHGAGQTRARFAGLGGSVQTGIQAAQIGSKAGGIVGGAIAAGSGVAAGAAAGSVVPIVGTAIGAVLGFAIGKFFGPAKLGQASIVWNDMVAHQYLQQQRGAAFDERYFAEAMKGAMDEGNNVWPGCGPDRHKNPDCFYGPLAALIRSAYVSGRVPVNATTLQVWQSVVLPWLQSGANGSVNWQNLSHEPGQPVNNTLQMLLIEGAVDRYINGLPITRADMPEYQGQGYTDHQPSISSVLQQAPAAPTVSSAVATQSQAVVPTPIVNAATATAQSIPANMIASTATGTSANTLAAYMQQFLGSSGQQVSPQAVNRIAGQVASQGVTQTAYGPAPQSALSKWLVPAGIIGVVALKVL